MEKIFKNPTIKIVAIALFASVLTGSIFYAFMKKDSVVESFRVKERSKLERDLLKTAADINQQAPIRINKNTVIINVFATKNAIAYLYSLDRDKSKMDLESFTQEGQKLLEDTFCKEPSTRYLLNKGVLMNASYLDKNDLFLGSFAIRKNNCESLQTSVPAVSSKAEEPDELQQALGKAVEDLKQQTPLKINNDTTLMSVMKAGNNIAYLYTLDRDKSKMSMGSFTQKRQKLLEDTLCKDPSSKKLLDKGALIISHYSDKNSLSLGSFTIGKNECTSLKNSAPIKM